MSAVDPPGGSGRRTVIVGGYGHVGRRLAELLAPRAPVVIAGRRKEPAVAVAAELAARWAIVDAATGAGLDGAAAVGDLVVNASSDQPTAALLRAAVDLGCDYVDLSADPVSVAAMLDCTDVVRERRRRALVGVGLSPGATNVLARAALEAAPDARRLDTVVVLSVLDDFGPAALEWTLRSLGSVPPMDRRGRRIVVESFRDARQLTVPGIGSVVAHEFPFPEQYFLPETLGVHASTSWCAFRPSLAGRAIAALARRPWARDLVVRPAIAHRLAAASGRFPTPQGGAVVGAAGIATGSAGITMVSLAARSESETTARCARALIDEWPAGPEAHGVHLPETVIEPSGYLERLSSEGMTIETDTVEPGR